MFHKALLESVGISELRSRRLARGIHSLDVDHRQGHPQRGSHFACCAVVKYPYESSLGVEGVTYRVIVHCSVDVPEAGLGRATFIHGRAQSELEAETLMINSPPPLVYTGDLSPGNGAAHNDKVFLPQLTSTRQALPEELTNQSDLDFLISNRLSY